jgi:hypothetical protein
MGGQQAVMRGSQDFNSNNTQFQNAGQGAANSHILKRINANQSTASNNKSLHNE